MTYDNLISLQNLFQAYSEFRKGKKKRLDLQIFERNLEDNLFALHLSLKVKTYHHGKYEEFFINDPKRRHIHKAPVADRVVHHLLYKYLYQVFDKSFIYDSNSCRIGKGTHKGVKRLDAFARKVSKNYSRDCFALKLDIKKFFARVDHQTLISLLKKRIKDKDIIWLLTEVINSFQTENRKGIPLGNLTSQIFANIYLNQLDQFVKHVLKVKYYIRYADDFIILDSNQEALNRYTCILAKFLKEKLKLDLHPQKVNIRKFSWGIDFLGYVVLPFYILPRRKTKRRILRKIKSRIQAYQNKQISDYSLNQTIQSYLGHLSHANTYKFRQKLLQQ